MFLNKKATLWVAKKNPRRPEHIKIRKSVAAFALAICPQIVIAQGLGPPNLAKFVDFCQRYCALVAKMSDFLTFYQGKYDK